MMNASQKQRIQKFLRKLSLLIPKPKITLQFRVPWELLVAVILSAQTTDKKVNGVTKMLFKKYKTIDDYQKATQTEFERDIQSIGLHRTKTSAILKTARMIRERFNNKIPRSMNNLLTLPGVGRKTANILMSVLYNDHQGIAVDTHVKRLAFLFGLTKNTNPERIENDLIALIPKNEWPDFSLRLIEYGKKYCPSRCEHNQCPLRNFILQTK